AIEKVAGYEDRHALLWHLVRKGAIDGAAEPELWDELNEGDANASSADVFAVISRISPAALKKCGTIDFVKGWPIVIDQLVATAYGKDPSPWEEGKDKLPKGFHDGFAILRARLGDKPTGKEAKRLRRVIADTHVRDGLYEGFWMKKDGAMTWTEVYTNRAPNEDFYRFVGLFGNKEEWQRTLLEAFLAERD